MVLAAIDRRLSRGTHDDVVEVEGLRIEPAREDADPWPWLSAIVL